MLILLMSAAIFSAILFSVYSWKIAGLKRINSDYYGLSYIGGCAVIMIIIVCRESTPQIAAMVCGITFVLFAIKSKLFHRELAILNTLKQGIEPSKAI